jgi:hypothetical protein
VLLDANLEVFLGEPSSDAHIALVSHCIGDDIYYVSSVGASFSVHATIIAPSTVLSSLFYKEISPMKSMT